MRKKNLQKKAIYLADNAIRNKEHRVQKRAKLRARQKDQKTNPQEIEMERSLMSVNGSVRNPAFDKPPSFSSQSLSSHLPFYGTLILWYNKFESGNSLSLKEQEQVHEELTKIALDKKTRRGYYLSEVLEYVSDLRDKFGVKFVIDKNDAEAQFLATLAEVYELPRVNSHLAPLEADGLFLNGMKKIYGKLVVIKDELLRGIYQPEVNESIYVLKEKTGTIASHVKQWSGDISKLVKTAKPDLKEDFIHDVSTPVSMQLKFTKSYLNKFKRKFAAVRRPYYSRSFLGSDC